MADVSGTGYYIQGFTVYHNVKIGGLRYRIQSINTPALLYITIVQDPSLTYTYFQYRAPAPALIAQAVDPGSTATAWARAEPIKDTIYSPLNRIKHCCHQHAPSIITIYKLHL